MMIPKKLPPNATIGLAAPSHIAEPARYERIIWSLQSLGYRVKIPANFYHATYGYAATE